MAPTPKTATKIGAGIATVVAVAAVGGAMALDQGSGGQTEAAASTPVAVAGWPTQATTGTPGAGGDIGAGGDDTATTCASPVAPAPGAAAATGARGSYVDDDEAYDDDSRAEREDHDDDAYEDHDDDEVEYDDTSWDAGAGAYREAAWCPPSSSATGVYQTPTGGYAPAPIPMPSQGATHSS